MNYTKISDQNLNEILLASDSITTGVIVIGHEENSFYGWLANEVKDNLHRLCGADFSIITSTQQFLTIFNTGTNSHVHSPVIILGDPDHNRTIQELQRDNIIDLTGLKVDGYIIKSLNYPLDSQNSCQAIILSGLDERSTMYAAYEFLEQLGMVFQFTGDIIPEQKCRLTFPLLELKREPFIARRGIHIRQFVMPWMGLAEFEKLIDQLAKLKCNYMEFYWYVGSPWVNFKYKNENVLIGDLNPKESGYLAWRSQSMTFTADDIVIGREHFDTKRVCAPEFQNCETQEDAFATAKSLLNRMIDYAHERKIEIWLGLGDCPCVHPNLGRQSQRGEWSTIMGRYMPVDDPAGAEIWTEMMKSTIESYPKADGYWLWLAEGYLDMSDTKTVSFLAKYNHLRHLLPTQQELRSMGYDVAYGDMKDEFLILSDLGLVHYGKTLMEKLCDEYPKTKFGVSVLGRSYLFPILDEAIPEGVGLQSMESCIVWNHSSRVPMHNFGKVKNRDTFLVPRLDDDVNELAMQFNISIYENDRVISDSHKYALSGIAPQTGKTRGLEHNIKYIANGCWDPLLNADTFYADYVTRIFGEKAKDKILKVYKTLEKNEMFLSLESYYGNWFTCQGLQNFCNFADSFYIGLMFQFNSQNVVYKGPEFPQWNVNEPRETSLFLKRLDYALLRFKESMIQLGAALKNLEESRSAVLPGSKDELEYLISKTRSFYLHLETLCSFIEGFLHYDAAFRAKKVGNTDEMLSQFQQCNTRFKESCRLAQAATEHMAVNPDHPAEKYILFRYNVRFLLPILEFQKFINNVVNFHLGLPYWEQVNWTIISPPLAYYS